MAHSKQHVKVIFLDIDGVICCNRYGRLEEDKLERLQAIVQQTDARIVLSTDWRRDPILKARLIGMLRRYQIEVIGATFKGPALQPIRPREICAWLDGYEQERRMYGSEPVSTWVAVDDRPLLREDGGDRLRGRFVQTTFQEGLNERAAQVMVEILNANEDTRAATDAAISHPLATTHNRTPPCTPPSRKLHCPPNETTSPPSVPRASRTSYRVPDPSSTAGARHSIECVRQPELGSSALLPSQSIPSLVGQPTPHELPPPRTPSTPLRAPSMAAPFSSTPPTTEALAPASIATAQTSGPCTLPSAAAVGLLTMQPEPLQRGGTPAASVRPSRPSVTAFRNFIIEGSHRNAWDVGGSSMSSSCLNGSMNSSSSMSALVSAPSACSTASFGGVVSPADAPPIRAASASGVACSSGCALGVGHGVGGGTAGVASSIPQGYSTLTSSASLTSLDPPPSHTVGLRGMHGGLVHAGMQGSAQGPRGSSRTLHHDRSSAVKSAAGNIFGTQQRALVSTSSQSPSPALKSAALQREAVLSLKQRPPCSGAPSGGGFNLANSRPPIGAPSRENPNAAAFARAQRFMRRANAASCDSGWAGTAPSQSLSHGISAPRLPASRYGSLLELTQ